MFGFGLIPLPLSRFCYQFSHEIVLKVFPRSSCLLHIHNRTFILGSCCTYFGRNHACSACETKRLAYGTYGASSYMLLSRRLT